MGTMTIGEFAARSRLSPKALRLYDRLGLLNPASVDPATGYRIYSDRQIDDARTIALLRRIDMPLATISEVIAANRRTAASMVTDFWADVSTRNAERSALVSYLQARLTGGTTIVHEPQTRTIADRDVLSINQHVHLDDTDAFFAAAFTRLRATGPGLSSIDGAPYLIFYGEVSDDSDGPLELCRPVQSNADTAPDAATDDHLQRRTEPAHDEVYIRLAKREMGWPAMLPAIEALEAWVTEHARQPVGPVRQVLIGDQRAAAADTPVCDLTIPLRPPVCTRGEASG